MVHHLDDVESVEFKGEGVLGVMKQIAVGPRDGWRDGYMRVFTVAPGGHSPEHRHPWWHVNYVIEGEGSLTIDGRQEALRAGSVAYVEGGSLHQFANTGKNPLKFICLVPPEGDHY